MGGTSWSDDIYRGRVQHRAATNQPTFAHDAAIRSGATARKAHDTLNPLNVKMRESRDSDAHPESLAIAVIFDVTGSMGGVPVVLQKKLAGLMNLIIGKGYVEHPQILNGAVGDAYTDNVPLQIGQFESGIEMEDNLTNIYLEGNGGGQQRESYDLAFYFLARHTSIDCFEKRGVKGYVFIIGDEGFYPQVDRRQVKALIGDDLTEDIPTEQIVRQLEERYHVFHILAMQGSVASDRTVQQQWKALLGERSLQLKDADTVAELIATTIGLTEGAVDLDTGVDHLQTVGSHASAAAAVRDALVPYAASAGGALTRPGSATGLAASADTPGVARL